MTVISAMNSRETVDRHLKRCADRGGFPWARGSESKLRPNCHDNSCLAADHQPKKNILSYFWVYPIQQRLSELPRFENKRWRERF
jgi:hypothetical protein